MKQTVTMAALLVTLLVVSSLVEGQLTFSKSWSSGRKRANGLAAPISGIAKLANRMEGLLKVRSKF